MSNFDRDRSGGRGGFGGGRGRDDRGGRGGRPDMFSVTCDECGRNCEVPFRPTGDRPVYCSECFGGGDSRGGRDFDRNDRGRGRDDRGRGGRDEERRMYAATCDQCGNDCELPFKPTSDKPVFCSDCFVKEDKPKKGDYKADFEALNVKLDLIMKALNISDEKKEVVKIKLTKDLKRVVAEDVENDGESLDELAPAKEKAAKKTAKKEIKADME